MTAASALDIYEEVTGGSVAGMDDEEIHLIVETVRSVRQARSKEAALSACLWMGHSEEWTDAFIAGVRQ